MRGPAEELISNDKTKLAAYSWLLDDQDPIAVIYFHHGLGEHAGRYETLFKRFNEEGIQVHSFDARGHGRTLGMNDKMAKGHLGNWQCAMDDIDLLIKSFPCDKPKFLLGHSMGGLLVTKYALEQASQNAFTGVIASAPAFEPGIPVAPLKYWAGRMAAPLLPRLAVKSGLDRSFLSRIPEVITAYNEDPLVHPYISLQTAKMILDEGEKLRNVGAPFMATNYLILHGTADKITSFPASKNFFSKLKMAEGITKESLWIDGGYHELHNDLCSEQVINKYVSWIKYKSTSGNK